MGNFYVNYTVRGEDSQAIADALRGRRALVSPARNGSVVVFDEESDSQDFGVVEQVGRPLSKSLRSPVLAVLNHDDDILQYWLFAEGEVSDSYNSSPSYFNPTASISDPTGGDAEKLCLAFGCGNSDEIERILRWIWSEGDDSYAFACDRHLALVETLRIAPFGVGFNWEQAVEEAADLFPSGGFIAVR